MEKPCGVDDMDTINVDAMLDVDGVTEVERYSSGSDGVDMGWTMGEEDSEDGEMDAGWIQCVGSVDVPCLHMAMRQSSEE